MFYILLPPKPLQHHCTVIDNAVVLAGNGEPTVNTSTAGEMPLSSSMVTITPLGGERNSGTIPNVNPAMNTMMAPGRVQVMNVLDVPQAPNTLEQFAIADTGFLEGIPGGMFDWGV